MTYSNAHLDNLKILLPLLKQLMEVITTYPKCQVKVKRRSQADKITMHRLRLSTMMTYSNTHLDNLKTQLPYSKRLMEVTTTYQKCPIKAKIWQNLPQADETAEHQSRALTTILNFTKAHLGNLKTQLSFSKRPMEVTMSHLNQEKRKKHPWVSIKKSVICFFTDSFSRPSSKRMEISDICILSS
jgi:hypothetical protein